LGRKKVCGDLLILESCIKCQPKITDR
jgi:hypothetical protein